MYLENVYAIIKSIIQINKFAGVQSVLKNYAFFDQVPIKYILYSD